MVGKLRVGVVNRYTPEKRRNYPLGLAIERAGAVFVPIDVRDIAASIGRHGGLDVRVAGDLQPDTSLGDLQVDGIAWRVSEATFNDYACIQHLLAGHYIVVNDWECASTCADKWRTSERLAAAGIQVVPTTLLTPGMKVPRFATGTDTVIKPCVGAGGEGVRLAKAGSDPAITEPHIAQPLIGGTFEDQVRTMVCGLKDVFAMIREPGQRTRGESLKVNNLEAGGRPVPADPGPVREISLITASCLGGEVLGVDLVKWNGDWAVLEVNSSPGIGGVDQVSDEDCYLAAAQSIMNRMRRLTLR